MEPDADRGIAGEVTRHEDVRYLQGATGHAVGSMLFLLGGGLLWVGGYGVLGFVSVAVAFLLSANGLSIWAWNRLRAHFEVQQRQSEDTGPTRTLTAQPFSHDSLVEMKAGAVMILVVVGLLVTGRLAIRVLDIRTVAYLCIGGLSLGNIAALTRAVYGES